MFRLLAFPFLVLSLVAFAAPQKVEDVLKYQSGSRAIPSKARIFLIAGWKNNANFAQEIADQYAHWLRRGFTHDDIACYYARPTQQGFERDQVQYTAIAADLAHCYPASPKVIWSHLKAAGARSGTDFVYVYASSHGTQPMTEIIRSSKIGFPQQLAFQGLLRALPDLDQYLLQLDSLPSGEPAELDQRLRAMGPRKEPASDHLFSPRYLRDALATWGESVPKYVAIQGCYSGGFLQAPPAAANPDLADDVLTNVPNLTAIASSRYDKTSFQCRTGQIRSPYGEIFHKALSTLVGAPHRLDWEKLYKSLVTAVEKAEKADSLPASEPVYFTNVP